MSVDARQVFVIERRAGRHGFLASLVPAGVHLRFGLSGDAGAAINPWDVDDVCAVPASKLAFLMRLHALLLGADDGGAKPPGLGELESELLAIAIRDVYARAADGEGTPSESLLRDVLADLARQEDADPLGSAVHAATYAELAGRLCALCAGGRFGDILDRSTRVDAAGRPLVVLDIARVPDEVAAAVVLAIVEFVSARAQHAPAGHISLLADVIDEPPGGEEQQLPLAFPRESLLNGLHDSYTRRRTRAGETRSIAYLHAISDVAHFLHPPTALSRGRWAHDVQINTTQGGRS